MSTDADSSAQTVRRPLLLRTMFDVLEASTMPRPAREVLDEVAARLELNHYEAGENRSGSPRFETFLRFVSSHASKVGWLAKRGGQWSLTEAGVEAVGGLTDDAELYTELNRRYRKTMRAHQKTLWQVAAIGDLLDVVEEGFWTGVTDLAEASDTSVDDVQRHLRSEELPNRYRVLADDGSLPPSVALFSEQRVKLEGEGILFDAAEHADPTQRITAEELREALRSVSDEIQVGRRAWLVRGSSVDGHNLVPTWLAGGWVSLAATNLRELDYRHGARSYKSSSASTISTNPTPYVRPRSPSLTRSSTK